MARSNMITGLGIIVVLVALIGGALLLSGGNSSDKKQDTAAITEKASAAQDKPQKNTIVDAAAANEDFSTLVTAVKAADLTATLSGDKKLTVFAPTNSAFDKLPAGTVDTLVKPENKQTLTSILTYHVVEGEVLSSQLKDGQKVPTVNGPELTISIEGGAVYITDTKGGKAMVTKADIKVDNGVIHAIDSVLMPS